jgi:tetraacyldisaccharide 4'-kinase
VAVVSRGYKRHSKGLQFSDKNTDPSVLGDEPYLIDRRTGALVVVCEDRVKAVQWIERSQPVDVIISDDGLLHWGLKPFIQIILSPLHAPLGNGALLPQGPLRAYRRDFPDALEWKESVDYQTEISNDLYQVSDPNRRVSIANLLGVQVKAYAGIARPDRFINTLKKLGLAPSLKAFPDHHDFSIKDFSDSDPIVMTEKDAVKCEDFVPKNAWFIKINVVLNQDVVQKIMEKIKGFKIYDR